MEKQKKVDIRELKEFVSNELPSSSELKSIILQEKDSISSKSFVIKLGIWMKLFREEQKKS